MRLATRHAASIGLPAADEAERQFFQECGSHGSDYLPHVEAVKIHHRWWREHRSLLSERGETDLMYMHLFECHIENILQRKFSPSVPRVQLERMDFINTFERPGLPALLLHDADEWKAKRAWTLDGLEQGPYRNTRLRCGETERQTPLSMKIKHFIQYTRVQQDLIPLYVFDPTFGRNADMYKDYTVPRCFQEDLFQHLGPKRPPFRWILIGPRRSGSFVHIDPLGTSAWNTLLEGRKHWVMFPPHMTEEFVKGRLLPTHPTPTDGKRDFAVFWFIDVLPRLRAMAKSQPQPHGIYECVQQPGETIFVPCGWWHAVLNLSDTVCVTHNYASKSNFVDVYSQTLNKHPDLAGKWRSGLEAAAAQEKEQGSADGNAEVSGDEATTDECHQRKYFSHLLQSIQGVTPTQQSKDASYGNDKAPAPVSALTPPVVVLARALATQAALTLEDDDYYGDEYDQDAEGDDADELQEKRERRERKQAERARVQSLVPLLQEDETADGLDGMTALHVVAAMGSMALFKLVLAERPLLVQSKDLLGRTPLICAAERGRDEVVCCLLRENADVMARDERGRTALIAAAEVGSQYSVKRLLKERGMPLDHVDHQQRSALIAAAEPGHDGVIGLLLQKGASLTLKDEDGRTAREAAAANGKGKTAAVLENAEKNGYSPALFLF